MTACLAGVLLAGSPIAGPIVASSAWEYHTENASPGPPVPGTPTNGTAPGAITPPPADPKAEEEEAAQLHAKAEQETKEKSEREAAASAHCVVPALHGKSLGTARKLLDAAHCTLGRVHHPRGRHHALVVSTQSPAAGKTLARGSAVNVTLVVKA